MRVGRVVDRTGKALVSGVAAGMVAALVAALLGARFLSPLPELAGRAVAIDGDSLRLDDDEIRLAGIDAPEYRQTCRGPRTEEPCGHAARDALVRWLTSAVVTCTITGTDRYGRKLGLCRVGDSDINREMVLAGQAVAFGRYEDEEKRAREARRGIWNTRFERPADWRARHTRD